MTKAELVAQVVDMIHNTDNLSDYDEDFGGLVHAILYDLGYSKETIDDLEYR